MTRELSSADEYQDIVEALDSWQQGDCAIKVSGFVYRFKASQPVTPESRSAGDDSDVVEADVPGFVVVTQTCDIRRAVSDRPYVDICALVTCPEWTSMDEIRRGLRPRFACIPGVSDRGVVADLDQLMTIEKPLLASWPRVPGCRTDDELRALAAAMSRKFSRFAFPDDFVATSRKLIDVIRHKHGKLLSDEGKALRELREIRVAVTPHWSAARVHLQFFFIRSDEQNGVRHQSWADWLTKWLGLIMPSGRYVSVDGIVLPLSRMRADEYITSDPLDLDHISTTTPPV